MGKLSIIGEDDIEKISKSVDRLQKTVGDYTAETKPDKKMQDNFVNSLLDLDSALDESLTQRAMALLEPDREEDLLLNLPPEE